MSQLVLIVTQLGPISTQALWNVRFLPWDGVGDAAASLCVLKEYLVYLEGVP